MNTNKIAVVYVRVSTEYQVDNFSVQDQRSLASLAERYGFSRVEVREEQGVSAETITARLVMKQLLEDICSELVGAIIVSTFTRLSRDMDDIDGRIIKKTCRDHDCVIITPEKLYDFSNEADDDLADLQFFFSKIQKRMNLKPMIRGEYVKAKHGGYVGQPLSVGYDHKWNEETSAKGTRMVADLVINEAEADVVRYIHDLFPNMLYRQIAVHLNELAAQGKGMQFPIKYPKLREKYKSDHRMWRDGDIKYILVNDIYVGRQQYAVNSKSPYLKGLEPVYTQREDLRIISDQVFERSQEIVRMRKRVHDRTKRYPHLFSGIMRCPLCGNVMAGRKQFQKMKSFVKERFSYNCSRYNWSGTVECPGYWINERDVLGAVVPILQEFFSVNLREHLTRAAAADPLHLQLESEIKAELAAIDQRMKNLLEAVQVGALSMAQIREQNLELQEAKHRLEKRLDNVRDLARVGNELKTVLDAFDRNFDTVLDDLLSNRLRFNTFIRIFFQEITVEIDRPGIGWRKGKKKGELPPSNPRITKFTLDPRFVAYIEQSGIELPALLKQASEDQPKRSSFQGSPCLIAGYLSGTEFVEALGLFLKGERGPVQGSAILQLSS